MSTEKWFCATSGLVPALVALPPALERLIVGLRELAYGESRLKDGTLAARCESGRPAMLTFEDCLGLAALTDGEVDAIARHEHIPAMVALELGSQLLRSRQGKQRVRQFVVDDILESQERNDCRDCARFGRVLGNFLVSHPECREVGADVAQQLRELIAIGLAQQACEPSAEGPRGSGATVGQIEDAKSCGDCRICAELSLRLMRSLERGNWMARGSDPRS